MSWAVFLTHPVNKIIAFTFAALFATPTIFKKVVFNAGITYILTYARGTFRWAIVACLIHNVSSIRALIGTCLLINELLFFTREHAFKLIHKKICRAECAANLVYFILIEGAVGNARIFIQIISRCALYALIFERSVTLDTCGEASSAFLTLNK